jgi:hypothetical protein
VAVAGGVTSTEPVLVIVGAPIAVITGLVLFVV